MRHLIKIAFVILNLLVGAALASSAIVTWLSAIDHPRLVIISMTAPVWIVLAAALLIFDFFFLRKWCIWQAICFGISLPLVFDIMPVNIPRGSVPERAKKGSWTLLNYNIVSYYDITGKYPGGINPAVSYILNSDADVVVLPEADDKIDRKGTCFTDSQMDSLKQRYPYRLAGSDITLMSKFPAKTIDLPGFPKQLYNRTKAESKAGAYELDINGKKTVIIGVHLQSLGLTRSDKNLYKEFTRGEGLTSKTELKEARKDLIGKVSKANLLRGLAINDICRFIDGLPKDVNVVVCGDFNDSPGCYSLRKLESIGLREVYPMVGHGYMYTYYKDRLFFQIDHVLFRGDLRPWSLKCDKLHSSDHFPNFTTFIEDN